MAKSAVGTPFAAAAVGFVGFALSQACVARAADQASRAVPLAPVLAWSRDEIADAAARCQRTLANVSARVEAHPPIREGVCGAASPVRLVSLGREKRVGLSPPLPMTCPMVVALARWVEATLQPIAETVLGEPIARLEGISSYQCRNQIGDPASVSDLSEHALANAIDISTFVTARGRRISVMRGWGPLDSGPRQPLPAPLPRGKAGDASLDGVFLRAIHAGACREFSTVIGPQSNAAHRDHFHFDLAAASGPDDRFCE